MTFPIQKTEAEWKALLAQKGAERGAFEVTRQAATERPFTGYTDRWGNIAEGCTDEGVDCVPLYISENVPQGDPLLNYDANVLQTNAPVQVYGADVPMRMPPWSDND